MKIIDSHMHCGSNIKMRISEEDIFKYIDSKEIIYGCISNISGCEFDTVNGKTIANSSYSQIRLNKDAIEFCEKLNKKIKVLFWIKPNQELYNSDIEKYILNNMKFIGGVKIHPRKSRLSFTVVNYKEYLDMCEKLRLNIVIHSENDEYCNPKLIYEVARIYTKINFIMVHMGLKTDHSDAIKIIKNTPNVYGDTTLVDVENVIRAVCICGSDKIIFGTDMPCDNAKVFNYYEMIREMKKRLPINEVENVLYNNSYKLFHFDKL
ncbi:amidohydrolase family protein [Ruminococcus sp. YE282]|uniref:amidohydrolase family protein n=1 Tax=Ruminococcus sp. YE282 TaxID=3158780 RepID=UPI000888DB9E|nr:hypothetical protein SAMN02910441_02055 [Ruminococcus bromii]